MKKPGFALNSWLEERAEVAEERVEIAEKIAETAKERAQQAELQLEKNFNIPV